MKNSTKRPWQGTLLGTIFSLLILIVPLITIMGLTTFIISFIISQSSKIAANFLSVFPIVMGVSFVMVIGMVLLTLGIFYGRRWIVGILLMGLILNLISEIITIIKLLISNSAFSYSSP